MIPHVRKYRLVALLAVLMALLLPACGSSGSDSEMPSVGDAPAQDGGRVRYPQEGVPEEGGDEEGRMRIRTKTLRLEVESTPDALDQVRELARAHDGSVTDMQVATDEGEWIYRYDEFGGDGTALRGWVTVRVPVEGFEDFVSDAADIGKIKYQSEATTDVTQEHVDLSARLENLRAQEERLREFFEAADDVDDMLAVEKELGRVRGEIESLDAQVTYLERQAAMATVTIELVEPRTVVRPGGESWGFVEAITDGVRGAASVLTGLLTFLIASSPVWLAALLLFFPVRAWLRRRRRGPVPTPEPAAPEDETVAK